MANPLSRPISGVFDQLARVYDFPLLQQTFYRPAQDAVVARLRRADAQRIADVGCGTGILSSRIAEELAPTAVYGCDMSDGMLAKARDRSAKVSWTRAPAEQLPFDDASIDAVISTNAFHFFDQPAAVAEFHRVLAPGGLMMIGVVNPSSAPRRFLLWLGSGGGSVGHFPTPEQMRSLATGAGFATVEHQVVRRWTGEGLTVATK
ncbi:methyltransferase domain-containing protein [Mycobacterium sp. 1274756.6]|uniref:class I SAM-dependent methyltransferase n=1 Tax=Mycobacterium sp. 1274756.6 TaxID=1834076 RepID=UPI0007FF367C|nr:methyltransferase domain-containing protein [Mycobacterium sp. 1274756.6]OBJ68232.1 hypothetical protein A5643_13875 [Mycobacterium sp. 1274756.6]